MRSSEEDGKPKITFTRLQDDTKQLSVADSFKETPKEAGGGGDRMEGGKGCPEEEIPGSRDARRWSHSQEMPGMLSLVPAE